MVKSGLTLLKKDSTKTTLVQHFQPSRHIEDFAFSARFAEDERFSSTIATL